ncbi:hypothetical protein ACKKBG_A36400 [Auxenochlorella protothecoides x Auxenochlorella symbiontica]
MGAVEPLEHSHIYRGPDWTQLPEELLAQVFGWMWDIPSSCASISQTCKTWHYVVLGKCPNLYPRGRDCAYERFNSVRHIDYGARAFHMTSKELARAVHATKHTLLEIHPTDKCRTVDVSPLQQCVHLRRLSLREMDVTDEVLESLLRHLPELRHLDVDGCNHLQGDFMLSLDACPLLTSLTVHMRGGHIAEAVLQALGRLRRLVVLKLETCGLGIHPSSLQAMLDNLGSLRSFSMENSCAFTNDFLECLADSLCAPLLEELDLAYTGISTMGGQDAWGLLLSFPSLRRLRLVGCKLGSGEGAGDAVAALLRRLPMLEALDLGCDSEPGTEVLLQFMASCGPRLHELALTVPTEWRAPLPPPLRGSRCARCACEPMAWARTVCCPSSAPARPAW